jgi:hypothetical protein
VPTSPTTHMSQMPWPSCRLGAPYTGARQDGGQVLGPRTRNPALGDAASRRSRLSGAGRA